MSWQFPRPCFWPQVLRTKLVSLSQVSSMLITRFPSLRSYSIARAYCCRRMRDLAELADGCSFFVLTKLSLNSCFKTCRTCFWFTSISSVSLTTLQTLCELSIPWPSLCMSYTALVMADLFLSFSFSRSFASRSFSGYCFASLTKSLTS